MPVDELEFDSMKTALPKLKKNSGLRNLIIPDAVVNY